MSFKDDAALLKTKLGEAKTFWDGVGDADLSAEQKQQIDTLNKETEELSVKVAESKEYQDIQARQAKTLSELSAPQGRPEFGNTDTRGREEVKSLGRLWTESAQYKELLARIAPTGQVSENFKFGESQSLEVKNLITGGSLNRDTGSGMTRPDYQGVIPLFLRPLTLRDVFTVGRTGSDMVEYTQITSFDNQAAPTAEASSVSAAGVATGGLKPQSGLTTALVKTAVKTIPHWIPITKKALADAPQMETYINNFLIQGAEIVLEDQMITGNNSGENFQGLDNTPGITLQAADSANDNLKVTRQARTKVRTIGRAIATAYLMNPIDWESFDLTKNTQGNYYFGGPLAMGLKTLWGLPVVESEAVKQGTFYVGDMKQAVLWDRERATILMSDSPNDFFLRNLVAILCELRAAFGVLRPAAIVRGDLLAGSNS